MYNEDVDAECSLALKYFNDGCIEMECARYEEAIELFNKSYDILKSENREDSKLADACLCKREQCEKCIIDRDIAVEEDKNIHVGTKEYSFGTYEGDMVVGVECGNGKFQFKDGRIIEGVFEREYCKGKCFYPDLGVYEGEFLNFKKHGKGVFTLNNGKKCKATWKNDFFDGLVVYIDEKTGKTETKYYENGVEKERKKTSNKR